MYSRTALREKSNKAADEDTKMQHLVSPIPAQIHDVHVFHWRAGAVSYVKTEAMKKTRWGLSKLREKDNLQRENHFNSDTSNDPPDSESSGNACIPACNHNTSQQGHPTFVLRYFLQNCSKSVRDIVMTNNLQCHLLRIHGDNVLNSVMKARTSHKRCESNNRFHAHPWLTEVSKTHNSKLNHIPRPDIRNVLLLVCSFHGLLIQNLQDRR